MTTNRVQHQHPSPDPADTNTHRIVADIGCGPTEVVFHIEQIEVLLELLREARKKGDLPEH